MDNFIFLLLDILIVAFALIMATFIAGIIFAFMNGQANDSVMMLNSFIGSGVGFCVAVIAKHTHAKR